MSPDNSQYDLARYYQYGSAQTSYLHHVNRFRGIIKSSWKRGTIIDVGAGRGIYSNHFLDKQFRVVAQDTSPSAFDAIHSGVTPHSGDLHSLSVYPDGIAYHAKDVIVDHIPLGQFFETITEFSPIGALVMLATLDRYDQDGLRSTPRQHGFKVIDEQEWTPTASESHGDWYTIRRKTRSVIIYQRS